MVSITHAIFSGTSSTVTTTMHGRSTIPSPVPGPIATGLSTSAPVSPITQYTMNYRGKEQSK